MGKLKDLTGQRFGRLIVIERGSNDSSNKTRWKCKCDCGNETLVRSSNLLNGTTTSCGCVRKEIARNKAIEQWKDEEYSNKMKDVMKDISNKLWEDEDYKNMRSNSTSEQNKLRWENEEYRKHMSETNKKVWEDEEYRKLHTKENHYNYNHNLTDKDREDRRMQEGYTEWSRQVKENANFTCDCCGTHGCKLYSHHLNSYNLYENLRLDLNNGVCLCEQCHKNFHKRYGYGNNTEQQYIEWKQIEQNKRGVIKDEH